MSSLPSNFTFNELPGNTIVPTFENEEIFSQYFNRIYEDIAFAVNNKDNIFYTIPITSSAVDIPIIPNFGAFLLCISGTDSGMPAYTWALTKADANLVGVFTTLLNQVGTSAPWVGATLTITSTLTNYQIRHSVANRSGNFNMRIISTF